MNNSSAVNLNFAGFVLAGCISLTVKHMSSSVLTNNWLVPIDSLSLDSSTASVILQVTSTDLHRHFHSLGAGVIEDVRVQRDKGFGFVRYSTHGEAALAIQMGNARLLCGKPIKVHCYGKSFLWYKL